MSAVTTTASFPCCPEMTQDNTCDVLDFFYRVNYPVTLRQDTGALAPIPVEVKLHFTLTRCPGPLLLGNLLYTTTLLPGEKVKLFTSDRRTRFTFDSTSKVSYRNTQTSEESFFMQQMSDSLFDTSSRDSGNSSNQSHAHVDGHGDAGVDILGLGGSANMSGDFDSNSLSTLLNEHSAMPSPPAKPLKWVRARLPACRWARYNPALTLSQSRKTISNRRRVSLPTRTNAMPSRFSSTGSTKPRQ